MYFILSIVPVSLCLLASIFLYKKLDPKWLRLFVYFLLFTLIVEITGYYYSNYLTKSNHFIINIYTLVSFCFYLCIFLKVFETKVARMFTTAAITLFILFYLYSIFYSGSIYIFNSNVFSFGSALIVSCSLLYFIQLFVADTFLNYFKIPMFWISTGLLFFFAGTLIYLSLLPFIVKNHLDPDGTVYQFIMVTLNIVLYGCITVSFFCNQRWKKRK